MNSGGSWRTNLKVEEGSRKSRMVGERGRTHGMFRMDWSKMRGARIGKVGGRRVMKRDFKVG